MKQVDHKLFDKEDLSVQDRLLLLRLLDSLYGVSKDDTVLITGTSGSGKSFLNEKLKSYGLATPLSLDDYGYWSNGEWITNEVKVKHDFDPSTMVLSGVSHNLADVVDYIGVDRVIIVVADPKVFRRANLNKSKAHWIEDDIKSHFRKHSQMTDSEILAHYGALYLRWADKGIPTRMVSLPRFPGEIGHWHKD